MLDINIYNQNEQIAIRELEKWQIRARHNLVVFNNAGFPARVNNIGELRQFYDTMNENRFDLFMNEIGGFTNEELDYFLKVCRLSIDFYKLYFPNYPIIVPLDNLMKYAVIYFRLKNLNWKSMLEIGPGSGMFSFFVYYKEDLELYTQVEVCQSFYMLEHYINFFLFKDKFKQHALLDPVKEVNFFYDKDYKNDALVAPVILKNKYKRDILCEQYPWWKLGELANNDVKYDIIMSNANLNEFSEGALHDYLNLKLKDNGIFFFYCYGGGNKDIFYIFEKLYNFKFVPLFFCELF